MHDSRLVHVPHALKELLHQQSDHLRAQGPSRVSQKLAEVYVAELLDEPDVVAGLNYVLELDDIFVVQLVKNRDLSHGGRWDPVVEILDFGAFERHNVTGVRLAEALVHGTVSTDADRIALNVIVVLSHLSCHVLLIVFRHLLSSSQALFNFSN